MEADSERRSTIAEKRSCAPFAFGLAALAIRASKANERRISGKLETRLAARTSRP
jgi:hypothetical protein